MQLASFAGNVRTDSSYSDLIHQADEMLSEVKGKRGTMHQLRQTMSKCRSRLRSELHNADLLALKLKWLNTKSTSFIKQYQRRR